MGKRSTSTTKAAQQRSLFQRYSRPWGSMCSRSFSWRKETHWRSSAVARSMQPYAHAQFRFGVCQCQTGMGLAVCYCTLREVDPGALSACHDEQRGLSGADREGSERGYDCCNHRPDFIQLAKRLGAIPTDGKVRRCVLLEVQRVPQAAASSPLEDRKPGCKHSGMDPFWGRRGMAQKVAWGPGQRSRRGFQAVYERANQHTVARGDREAIP